MDSSGLNRHNDHQKDQVNQQGNAPPQPQFAAQTGRPGAEDDESGDESEQEKPMRRSGRRKIKIEYIEDKNRRHITFSKRKAGIMKKAYELSTLTGTQVLLLVVSETGLVYTFTTVKLQPIVTKPEGKNLIQACLNAPDPVQPEQSTSSSSPQPGTSDDHYANSTPKTEKSSYDEKKVDHYHQSPQAGPAAAAAGYQPYNWPGHHPGYMGSATAAAAAPGAPGAAPNAYQPSQQQQHHPMPYIPQQHAGYWPGSSSQHAPPPMPRQPYNQAPHQSPRAPSTDDKDNRNNGAVPQNQ
ncbi:hypothetical protein VTP01DRAFT_8905 [Rhizomucor pusillus]|uniref:uncharacterized protein n=1 Tax=Rhizomucor pusillus TaxID=4840 RepID=UPI0037441DC8